jgi:hypothetical protein
LEQVPLLLQQRYGRRVTHSHDCFGHKGTIYFSHLVKRIAMGCNILIS